MEADWAAEIGPGLDWIDADWSGFVDLRSRPEAVTAIPEANANPGLREMLAMLNVPGSPVFTCKCDVWPLAAEEIDPMEFDCPCSGTRTGVACWIDMIARDPKFFGSFQKHEAWVRRAANRLRGLPVSPGRADWVIRSAVHGGHRGFGVTLYCAGCGVDVRAAEVAWEMLLRAATTITIKEAALPHSPAKGE